MRAATVLADFAETDTSSGKIHMLGAGWSVTGPGPITHAVVTFIQVPPARIGHPLQVMLRLLDAANEVVEVQGNLGAPQPLEIRGQVEARAPEGWDHATDLQTVFAVNLVGLPLTPGRTYRWSVAVDEKELTSTAFYVRAAPPAGKA